MSIIIILAIYSLSNKLSPTIKYEGLVQQASIRVLYHNTYKYSLIVCQTFLHACPCLLPSSSLRNFQELSTKILEMDLDFGLPGGAALRRMDLVSFARRIRVLTYPAEGKNNNHTAPMQ
jgi:hypothetical protein